MAHVVVYSVFYLLVFSISTLCDILEDKPSPARKQELKNAYLPPCKLCRVLVDSFKRGLDTTEKSNFQGGDTAWEEEKLGNYASSEIRFVEVQEHVCSDVERGSSQCHTLAEKAESSLEKWWFNLKRRPDLFKFLCIDELRYCCPLHHFGPQCLACPGYPNAVCSGNGKCRGAGTRKGNGTCSCDKGYIGDACDACESGHYESYRDESKFLCSKCHSACRDSCTQAGPRGCVECNLGWFHYTDRGCVDVNECISDDYPCTGNEFCVNNEGSYSCLACDKACNGCQGDGPDMCDSCANGFILKDGLCVSGEDDWGTQWDMRRYLTYLGLCIATCIIFQKNPAVASFIGLGVAIYVTVSEYMLGVGSSNDNSPLLQF